MKLDDRVLGGGLFAFGALVFWHAQSFPLMAGLPYGPGLFPSIAAVGMMACGAAIALFRKPVPASSQTPAGTDNRPTGAAAAFRLAAILAIVIAMALSMDWLGFHISASLCVAATALVFGRGPVSALALGITSAFVAHAIFYSFLRVPLPWGLLEPVAW